MLENGEVGTGRRRGQKVGEKLEEKRKVEVKKDTAEAEKKYLRLRTKEQQKRKDKQFRGQDKAKWPLFLWKPASFQDRPNHIVPR